MKPQKFPYYEWEDYKAGIYNLRWDNGKDEYDAKAILKDSSRLETGMRQAVSDWPKAAAHHLTDGGMNQRAWLGWAACGILEHIPAHVTRAAWWQLTESERQAANSVADSIISTYRNPYAKTLFDD